MTPSSRDDQSPDPAALDELLRAFGVEVGAGGAVEPPVDADAADEDDDAVVDDDEDDDEAFDDDAVDEMFAADPVADPSPVPAVITITDEDLPDAVYIQGQLDPPRGGTTDSGGTVVFIDDDDTVDAIDVAPHAAASIDPKIRDRRIAVRRAEGRKRLKWFFLAGAIVAVVVGVLAVLGSPLFSIEADQVRITGNVYTDPEALQAVVDDLVGTPTLVADTRAAERELEQIPWVAEARVRTRFPSAATIEISERSPLATYAGTDGRFRVIDRDGRVLDVLDGQPVAYMLLTGPDALDLQPGQFTPPGHAAAAELVQALTPSVRGRVTSIEVVGDGSDLRMFLDDGMEIRFGAASDLLVKLVRLETVLPTALERELTVVDVSTAEVTVR